MHALLFDWPYFGLILAAALLALLLLEKRPPGAPSRLRDPAFVLGLLWPMYLIHQFEEHGIDLVGRHYAFLPEMCRVLGFGAEAARCPGTPAFIFAVNCLGCWMAGALALALRRRRPLVAAAAWGIPLVNAATHLGAGVIHGAYNPGLLTSVLLFVPMGAWMLHTVLSSALVSRRQLPRIFACGAAVHLVLVGSLLARERGLPTGLFLLINVVNGLWPLAFGLLGIQRTQPDAALAQP